MALALLGACKQKEAAKETPTAAAISDGGGAIAVRPPDPPRRALPGQVLLPPAPPVPPVPLGLPATPAEHAPTAEQIALGRMLFFENRLAADGTSTCAACHLPDRGWSGDEPHSQTAAGKPNLRRAPALYNLVWFPELGWDGRGASRLEFITTHVAGQLGQPIERGLQRVLGSPTYQAHFALADRGGDAVTTAAAALWAFAATRYSGGAPWDRYEAGETTAVVPAAVEGYKLFNGKAQCATCHAPPLYTDVGYHRLGLIRSPDEGRGLVDPTSVGAFKTPTLRGAALRRHLDGGRGHQADPSVIDPALVAVTLTDDERAALTAFVQSLTVLPAAAELARPDLPTDVPDAR
jgi:cytochrome c peroxidase